MKSLLHLKKAYSILYTSVCLNPFVFPMTGCLWVHMIHSELTRGFAHIKLEKIFFDLVATFPLPLLSS